jgi:hypothetical protein
VIALSRPVITRRSDVTESQLDIAGRSYSPFTRRHSPFRPLRRQRRCRGIDPGRHRHGRTHDYRSREESEKVRRFKYRYYTIQHLKSGRRANGTNSVDVLATATQLNGSTRLNSLEETVAIDECGNELFELHDLLSNDREDPSMQAARKMDWDTFCRGLSDLERLVVEYLSAGRTLRDAARQAGLSDLTMQNYRRKIAVKIQEFMGAEILSEIAVLPRWKDGLNADRELLRAGRNAGRWLDARKGTNITKRICSRAFFLLAISWIWRRGSESASKVTNDSHNMPDFTGHSSGLCHY